MSGRLATLERLRLVGAVEEAAAVVAQASAALVAWDERVQSTRAAAADATEASAFEGALEAGVASVAELADGRARRAATAASLDQDASEAESSRTGAMARHRAAVAALGLAERMLARHDRVVKLRESVEGSGEPI